MKRRSVGTGALLAVVLLAGCSPALPGAPQPPYFEPEPVSLKPGDVFPLLTFYGGWWSTPAFSPNTAGLPERVALVRSGTGRYVAGYDRITGTLVSGRDIEPPDYWPDDSIMVLDAETGVVWDQFRVDDEGLPTAPSGAVSVEQRFPPIAEDPPPGELHTFTKNAFTGAVIYVGLFPEEELAKGNVEADW